MAREPRIEDDGRCWLQMRIKVDPSVVADIERLRVAVGRELGIHTMTGTQIMMKCLSKGIDVLKEYYDE